MSKLEYVAEVVSWTNGSYHRNYKLNWLQDVEVGTKLYTGLPSEVRELLEELTTDGAMLKRIGQLLEKYS